ncbi:MAG: hypothetical protein ACFB3T_02070, partial [Geminicoccaceae bacterium]
MFTRYRLPLVRTLAALGAVVVISASHQGRADEDTTQSLSDALNDPNPVTRAWAIGQLGKEFDAS